MACNRAVGDKPLGGGGTGRGRPISARGLIRGSPISATGVIRGRPGWGSRLWGWRRCGRWQLDGRRFGLLVWLGGSQ